MQIYGKIIKKTDSYQVLSYPMTIRFRSYDKGEFFAGLAKTATFTQ